MRRAGTTGLAIATVSMVIAACGSSSKTSPGTPAGTTATTTAAKSYALKATLMPGNETPKPKGAPAGARGTFTGTITYHGTSATLTWVLTFTGLSGPAAAAHIHIGPAGTSGPIAVPLCGPCKSPNKGTLTGAVAGNPQLLKALMQGGSGAYVNVHTKLNAGGEIRGQLTATPSPAAGAAAPSTSTKSGSAPTY